MNYAVVENEKNMNRDVKNLQSERTKDSVQKEIVQKKLLETASSGTFSIPDTETGQAQIHTDSEGTVHVKTESKT